MKTYQHQTDEFGPVRVNSNSSIDNVVSPMRYVTVRLASALTGLTEKAIRRKIEDGKWIEGREFRRSPDGGIFISVTGFAKWVEAAAA